jgi:hypothetical protein
VQNKVQPEKPVFLAYNWKAPKRGFNWRAAAGAIGREYIGAVEAGKRV